MKTAALNIILSLTLLCAASAARAEVTVSDHVLQKGVFSPPNCDGSGNCLCESDIHYPVLSGMRDTARQSVINDELQKSADQLKCQGTQASAKSEDDNFSVRHHYEVTLSTPHILALRITDWAYEGGAHGNGTVEGIIIDLDNGKILTPDEIFSTKNIADINKVIYDALAPKADGVFRDEVENRKGAFIKDGKCQGCTLMLDKTGLQVVFQAYEVAPFADGNPAVPIPAKDIAYPALKEAAGSQTK